MDQTKLATIIVPIYNVEAYLAECIDSIMAQTYRNLQIILVDDGSPDRCGEICDAYAAKDPRIEVVHKPNGGLGSARNAGLDISRGDYVYFVDSDDSIVPETVETTIKEMEAGNWDMVAYGLQAFEEEDRSITYSLGRSDRREFRFQTEYERSRFLCLYYLNGRVRWEACSRVFRGDIIEKYHLRFGNERKIFAEDLDFSYRYVVHCSNMLCLPQCFYNYRLHGSSIMHTKKWLNRCQQLSYMLVWQKEQLGQSFPYGKRYLNEAVIISTFLGSNGEDYDPVAHAKELREIFESTENWPYIQQEMKLAAADPMGFLKSCGILYGYFVHKLCIYMAEGDYDRYVGRAKRHYWLFQRYERMSGVKSIVYRHLRPYIKKL